MTEYENWNLPNIHTSCYSLYMGIHHHHFSLQMFLSLDPLMILSQKLSLHHSPLLPYEIYTFPRVALLSPLATCYWVCVGYYWIVSWCPKTPSSWNLMALHPTEFICFWFDLVIHLHFVGRMILQNIIRIIFKIWWITWFDNWHIRHVGGNELVGFRKVSLL